MDRRRGIAGAVPLSASSKVNSSLPAKRRGGPLDAAAPATKRATGVSGSAAAAAPAADETWEDISARTGLGPRETLSRKIAFKKGTLPAKKVEEMAPVIKELKALGNHLLAEGSKAQKEADEARARGEKMTSEAEAASAERDAAKAAAKQQLDEALAALAKAESAGAELRQRLSEAEYAAATKDAEVEAARAALANRETEVASAKEDLGKREEKLRALDDSVQSSQRHSASLQSYNTALQGDINTEKARREEVLRAREALQAEVAELSGLVKSGERMLQMEKDAVQQLRDEREAAAREAAVLRSDIAATRGDRERLAAEVAELKDELDKYREAGGKSAESLRALIEGKASLESQLTSQRTLLDTLRNDLGATKDSQEAAESLAASRGTQLEGVKAQLAALQAQLADAERRVFKSELVRRKLLNTIQELRGNVRVFARVRPSPEAAAAPEAVAFPTSGDLLGRGLELSVASERHSFAFDRVFGPGAGQEAVYEEAAELAAGALDGGKICIFAHGPAGAGKTHAVVGTTEAPGLLPRVLRHALEATRQRGPMGWSYRLKASFLSIVEEEYRDMAAADGAGKKLMVSHDAGVTTVSDLTLVDIDGAGAIDAFVAKALERRAPGTASEGCAVFSLRVEGTNASAGSKVAGVLHLVDLAASDAPDKGLTALGDAVFALAAGRAPSFKSSKLTWLLQTALGGEARALLVAAVPAGPEGAPKALEALRFAARVNACEIGSKAAGRQGGK